MPDTTLFTYRCCQSHDGCGVTFSGPRGDVLEHVAVHCARDHADPIVDSARVDEILDHMAPLGR